MAGASTTLHCITLTLHYIALHYTCNDGRTIWGNIQSEADSSSLIKGNYKLSMEFITLWSYCIKQLNGQKKKYELLSCPLTHPLVLTLSTCPPHTWPSCSQRSLHNKHLGTPSGDALAFVAHGIRNFQNVPSHFQPSMPNSRTCSLHRKIKIITPVIIVYYSIELLSSKYFDLNHECVSSIQHMHVIVKRHSFN